jgi:hypothetical protein
VTGAATAASGAGLYARLSTSFGTLMTDGYCTGSDCQRFAVLIGEFGSKFESVADKETMADLATFFNNEGAAADGRHLPITSWFYWSWNSNSEDTGGLVDNWWVEVEWKKIEYLRTVGLTSGLAVSPLPPPSPPAPPPRPPPPPAACQVSVEMASPWAYAGGYATTLNVKLQPFVSVAVPWTLTLGNAGYSSVVSSWGAWGGVVITSTALQGSGTQAIPSATFVSVGAQVQGGDDNLMPKTATLNGMPCALPSGQAEPPTSPALSPIPARPPPPRSPPPPNPPPPPRPPPPPKRSPPPRPPPPRKPPPPRPPPPRKPPPSKRPPPKTVG